MRREHPRRAIAAVAAFAAAAALLAGLAFADPAPARRRPANPDEVVIALPPGLPRATAGAESSPDSAAAQAEAFIALARSTRDARFYGRAESAVEPWLARADATPRLLVAAADLAQQRHAFTEARVLLDRAIARDARDPGTLVRRANVNLILGEHGAARRDCATAMQGGAALPATICLATTMTGPGSVRRARRILSTLDGADAASPEIAVWRLLAAADLALRDRDVPAAIGLLARAHALAPEHDEARARLADALLQSGDARAALALTDGPFRSAALLVVRIRAASPQRVGDAEAARRELDALLEVGRRRGTRLHLREEGELALYVDHDATRALDLARRNFELQKDTPDVRLLADAAVAAGDRAAIASLRGWLAATGFEDRVTAARIAGDRS